MLGSHDPALAKLVLDYSHTRLDCLVDFRVRQNLASLVPMVSDKASAASSSETTAVFDNNSAAAKARPDPGVGPDVPTAAAAAARTGGANTNGKEADTVTIADTKPESNLDLEQALSAPVPLGGEEATVTSDEVPNGGYGWVIVVCLLGVNACTWGE